MMQFGGESLCFRCSCVNSKTNRRKVLRTADVFFCVFSSLSNGVRFDVSLVVVGKRVGSFCVCNVYLPWLLWVDIEISRWHGIYQITFFAIFVKFHSYLIND